MLQVTTLGQRVASASAVQPDTNSGATRYCQKMTSATASAPAPATCAMISALFAVGT